MNPAATSALDLPTSLGLKEKEYKLGKISKYQCHCFNYSFKLALKSCKLKMKIEWKSKKSKSFSIFFFYLSLILVIGLRSCWDITSKDLVKQTDPNTNI